MSDVVESRLRELLAKATPRPWYTLDPPWLTSGETSILAESPDPHVARFICDFDMWALDDEDDRKSENPDADAALIVAAVNALPDLLDEITRLRAQVASLTAAVEGERERCARVAEGECENQIAAAKVIMGLSDDFADEGVCVGAAQCAHRIAAAIREGG